VIAATPVVGATGGAKAAPVGRPTPRGLAAYSLLGAPLAMMALPVYVLVPKFYFDATGLALSIIGAMLLLTRLADAFIDPILGAWIDRSKGRSCLRPVLVGMPPLVLGFVLLFLPPAGLSAMAAAAWLAATLMAAYFGYSLASIAYQAWGAGLADTDGDRTRVTAWREGAGLVGVILASVVPYALGAPSLVVLFLAALAVALYVLVRHAPRPPDRNLAESPTATRAIALPLATSRFRWLLAVFIANGIAAAIPASLVLFFVADRLQLETSSGLFLALYFIAGAASMPLWARLARQFPLEGVWLIGMVAAVAAFVWAHALGAGHFTAFALICALSGVALGADLALPPALLARVIDRNGHTGRHEGAYFGLWNLANKLNLALAAGIALPALGLLGYVPGSRAPEALAALSFAYALLPCALKLVAAALLATAWRTRRL
jgi:glycoside/pentoside/hexuronide:cation symporter, GPH family